MLGPGVPRASGAAAVGNSLDLRPLSADTLFTVEAHFPKDPGVCPERQRGALRARYRGAVRIVRESGGSLSLINTLSFSSYLKGLAEVPASWPAPALEAQAIAARSYAVYSQAHAPASYARRGFDICASDQCQVYRGATVELGAFGDRWARAVDRTRGSVLTYGGSVIQAFYFSTSTGRTRSNAEVWGGSPRPYLRSVLAHDEDAPLARWTARIRLADLDDILRRAGRWSGGAITDVRASEGRATVSGAGGSRSMTLRQLRSALNRHAPCVDADRYPTRGSQSGGRLPLTVPSSTYSVRRDGGAAVLEGRGWGHDVGMSQWGARALADRGWSPDRILAHYYRGTALDRIEEPGEIRVLAIEGATRIRVRVDGTATARTADGETLSPGNEFEARAGPSLAIERGIGPASAPVLDVTSGLPGEVSLAAGEPLAVPFTISRPARVAVTITGDGMIVAQEYRSFESGTHEVAFGALGPGAYRVDIQAFDGLDTITAKPVAVVVAQPTPSPAPTGEQAPRAAWPLLVAGALVIGITLLAHAVRRRGR